MIAINTLARSLPLDQWILFWKGTGAGEVVWAQDKDSSAAKAYRLLALGTEVIVDQEGSVAFRSDGPAGYKKLMSEIEKLL